MRSLVTTSLAAAVAAAGLASGWHPAAQASSSLWVAQASQLASQNLSLVAQQVEAFQKGIYMVEFNEPGLVERHQERQARSTNPERFNFQSAQTQADLQALQRIQSQHVSAIRAAGLNQTPKHYYLATHSGISIHIETQAQLDALRSLSFIKSVTPDTVETIQTHRSAAFVGANKIWDGTAVPGGAGTRGQGMIVAILDTGIDHTRPSFSNDASCGFSDTTPKIISRLDCSSADADGVCNGSNPMDTNGHGTHVASTAAGNVVTKAQDPALNPSDGDEISGIAPCAQIRAYKVCATDSCAGSDIAAGMNSVIAHGDVDSMNFSISGGLSPWTTGDGDRRKLDLVDAGVFVAASAGNTRLGMPDPIGMVNHLGPWVMTVASSTHDKQQPSLDASAGPSSANPPPATQGMDLSIGSDSPVASAGTLPLKRPEASNELGCVAHPANYFNGQAALIHRGECTFTEKIQHAFDAGAALVIIRNNQAGTLSMNTTGQPNVPAYSIGDQAVGNALADFVAANAGVANITMTPSFPEGDVLSGFSLRGPTSGNMASLTKPDITAPGDSVYAAVPGGYGWMGGTSMSSPQVAGAAALMRKIHPEWTPMEVKSALMMTAKTQGKKDGINGNPSTGNWDADDVGNGRMDLTKAAKAGLVMDETKANFLAANPANGGNPRELNLPSMRNISCTPSCTWTRTVRNTLGEAVDWTVETEGFNGKMSIEVTPSSFSFNGDTDATQELTIVATPIGDQSAAVAFGQITLKADADKSPDMHMTVAIKGVLHSEPLIEVDPTSIAADAPSGSSTVVNRTLRIKNVGGADLTWSHDTAGGGGGNTPFLHDQPVASTSGLISAYSTEASAGATTAADFTITAETTLSKIEVYGFDNDASSNILETSTALNWVIYPDDNGKPNGSYATTPPHQGNAWFFSTAPNSAGITLSETGQQMTAALDLAAAGQSVVLPPGKYWLTFYPTMPGGLAPRFNWYGSEQVDSGSMLIAPNPPFNVDEWTLTGPGGLGTSVLDVAFKLEGTQGAALCDTAWITIDPTSGTVTSGEHTDVTVKLDPNGLADGAHTGTICLNSNSGGTTTQTLVPVTFTIGGGSPPGPEANLGINASGTPESVNAGGDVAFLISAANFGPDEASEVKVELTLPNGMSFVSGAAVPASTRKNPTEGNDRASSWNCSDNANVVTCEHDGNLTGIAQPLRVNVTVDPATPAGTLTTTVVISAAEDDPSPANNTATVLTQVTSTDIFSDGFEEVTVNPNLVDSGPVELNLTDADDKILNLVTGEFVDYSDSYVGGDINFYRSASGNFSAYLFADATPGQGAVAIEDGSTQIAVLQTGATVGEDSPITGSGGNNLTEWYSGVTGYIGLKFRNEETGEFNYGYIELETTGPAAYPAKITRYVYDKSGEAITIPTP